MFRQEVFDQIIAYGGLTNEPRVDFRDNPEETILLYIAYRMTTLMSQRGLKPVAKLDSSNEVAVVDFGVKAGEIILKYYDPREGGWHDTYLDFDNGFRPRLSNTWLHQPTTVADLDHPELNGNLAGEGRKSPVKREVLRNDTSDAERVMDNVDLSLVRSVYEQALAEILALFNKTTFSSVAPNYDLVEGSTIFELSERNRVLAAWVLKEHVKRPAEKPGDYPIDLVVRNLVTGVTVFAFSGHFGTEQQWLKATSKHRERGRIVGPFELSREEQAFINFFNDHLKEATVPEEVWKNRRSSYL